MSARPLALLLALLLLAASGALRPARAQRPAYAASVSPELDSVTAAALLREVERASGRGLPTEPLLAKAREGRLKRAPGARIRQAVATLAIRLDSARSALGADTPVDALVAGAEALAAGAGPDALRAVRSAGTTPVLTVPLGALAQLVASGVPPARATAMIVDLLRRHVSPARVVAFGNAVESDVAAGLPPDDAAQFRLRAADGASSAGATAVDAPAANVGGFHTSPPPPPSVISPRRRP